MDFTRWDAARRRLLVFDGDVKSLKTENFSLSSINPTLRELCRTTLISIQSITTASDVVEIYAGSHRSISVCNVLSVEIDKYARKWPPL